MHRSALLRVTVVVSTGALLVGGASPAFADGHHDRAQWVSVTGTGSSVQLSDDTVHAGLVHFRVSTTSPTTPQGGGSEVTLFTLNDGHSLSTVFRDLRLEFSQDPKQAAKGTRELNEDATYYGLADVQKGYDVTATATLDKGTYYLFDLASVDPTKADPEVTTLHVGSGRGHDEGSDVRSQVVVKGTSQDRFDVSSTHWRSRGAFTWENVSDTIHFAALQPVKAGTTDEQVQEYLDSGAQTPPDFFVEGPGAGADVVSPGRSEQISYDLPKGTYVLLCFIADDETGMPHAVMGMHRVVTLD
jgi:hypothetical protein